MVIRYNCENVLEDYVTYHLRNTVLMILHYPDGSLMSQNLAIIHIKSRMKEKINDY